MDRGKYLANREFTKYLRHNGNTYLVKSVFDTDQAELDFDDTIAKYNKKENRFEFDKSIQRLTYNQYNLHDDLDTIYNTVFLND